MKTLKQVYFWVIMLLALPAAGACGIKYGAWAWVLLVVMQMPWLADIAKAYKESNA